MLRYKKCSNASRTSGIGVIIDDESGEIVAFVNKRYVLPAVPTKVELLERVLSDESLREKLNIEGDIDFAEGPGTYLVRRL